MLASKYIYVFNSVLFISTVRLQHTYVIVNCAMTFRRLFSAISVFAYSQIFSNISYNLPTMVRHSN